MRGAGGTMRMKRLPAAKALALRRRRLMGRMGSRDVALLSAAPETFHSNDVEHRYRPDSDLFYLTGFSEPGAVAVLAPGHRHGDFWLVVRPRDPAKETWTGPRAGVQGARAIYGAAVARPLDALEEVVEQVLARAATLYHMPGLVLPGRSADGRSHGYLSGSCMHAPPGRESTVHRLQGSMRGERTRRPPGPCASPP